MLYLLKGSRVQEYHHQNVAIVGAPEGERIEIVYSERWITPGLEITEGSECTIVFADSPYTTFVPIRFGVIESVAHGDAHTTLSVKLTALVRAGGQERLQELWSRFDAKDENRPGRRFVLEDANPGLIGPQGIDELEDAWRTSVDALAGGYFARSSFATVRRRFDHRGIEIDSRQPVPVRTQMEVELEIRTPTEGADPVRIYVESTPEGAVEAPELGELPRSGIVRVPITPLVSGHVQISFRLLPEPLKSSRPTLALTVLPADQAAKPAAPEPTSPRTTEVDGGVSPHEIRRLERYLRNSAEMSDRQWLVLYDEYFLTWAPSDPRLLSGYADQAFKAGRFLDCVKALQTIETRRPEEDSLLLIAALRGGVKIDLPSLLQRVDFRDDVTFGTFLEALPDVDGSTLEVLVDELSRGVLGDEKLVRLASATIPKLRSTPALIRLVEDVAYLDPEACADAVMSRWSPQQAPDRILELLIEWRVHPKRLLPYFSEALSRAEDARNWPRVRELGEAARQLFRGDEQTRALLVVGDVLVDSDDQAMSDSGFETLIEVVSRMIANGEFDLAVRFAMVVRGRATIRGDEGFIAAADELSEKARTALDHSPVLQDWLRREGDLRTAALRKRLNGWTLHLVGGQEEPWAAELEGELGLAEVIWHESEKKKSPNSDWANSLDPDKAIVVIIHQFISHALSGQVKQKCSKRGVGCFESNCLKRDVLKELEMHLNSRRAKQSGGSSW